MTISIITPSFNQGKYIERTIQSVLQQHSPGIHYLVIDGASTDNTREILKRYTNQLTWISEPDNGQTDAINKGLRKTSSEIIGWLNSDDIYYPDAIEYVMDYFQQHPDIDILYGEANHIDSNDKILERYPTQPWNLTSLLKTCFISQPAVFFRRRVIEKYGLLDTQLHYCMDYEFWLRLGLAGAKFAYVPKLLAGSRLYPETKTMSKPDACYQETMQMLKKKLGYIPNAWLLNYVLHKTRLSRLRLLNILLMTPYLSMRRNGFLRGLITACSLPFMLLKKFGS